MKEREKQKPIAPSTFVSSSSLPKSSSFSSLWLSFWVSFKSFDLVLFVFQIFNCNVPLLWLLRVRNHRSAPPIPVLESSEEESTIPVMAKPVTRWNNKEWLYDSQISFFFPSNPSSVCVKDLIFILKTWFFFLFVVKDLILFVTTDLILFVALDLILFGIWY